MPEGPWTHSEKIILENGLPLNGARKKCPGTSNKKYSGRYCTVLYCTAVLYKYHAWVVSVLQHREVPNGWHGEPDLRQYRDCMGHTLHRRHIITRNDITRRIHRRHIIPRSDITRSIHRDIIRLDITHRSGPGRMTPAAPTSTSSSSHRGSSLEQSGDSSNFAFNFQSSLVDKVHVGNNLDSSKYQIWSWLVPES